MNERNDSFLPVYFGVEIEGIESSHFKSCSGLEAVNYIYEVKEGGLNSNNLKFIGGTHFTNIILENGTTANNDLYEWYKDTCITEKKIVRKNGSVIMYNAMGEELKRWNFFRAIPCSWTGPVLETNKKGIAVEKIEISHEGLEIG